MGEEEEEEEKEEEEDKEKREKVAWSNKAEDSLGLVYMCMKSENIPQKCFYCISIACPEYNNCMHTVYRQGEGSGC